MSLSSTTDPRVASAIPMPPLRERRNSGMDAIMVVSLSYFLCSSPRTGSTLLANALESSGIAGRPKEYFERKHEKHWIDRLGISSDAEYIEKILAAGSTPNGVFGAKVHWFQLTHLLSKLRLLQGFDKSEVELLKAPFPSLRYVFLTRRDKVRQAVSYYRATESDVWWSYRQDEDARANRGRPAPAVPFQIESIDEYIIYINNHESGWRRYFERTGVEPFEVVYEEFAQAYESTVLEILRHLEIPIPEGLRIAPPRLQKLADEISEDWVNRYHEHKRTIHAVRRPPERSYFIGATPRTGGGLLAEALESTGVAGRPMEFFDPGHERYWMERLDIMAESEYLERVLDAGMTPNGVFGARILWHQVGHLTAKLRSMQGDDLSQLDRLRRAFPDLRFVFLTRRDKVQQAVSYYRAIRTGIWWSIRADEREDKKGPPPPAAAPPFDFEQIDHWVTRLSFMEAEWRRFFTSSGIEPFEVVYEEFTEAYEATVLSILRFLELPVSAGVKVAPPRLQKQEDQVSDEYVRRYHELKESARAGRRTIGLSYLICCTPRTGSTLLCEALESTKLAGRPKEYFDPTFKMHWQRELGIRTDDEYIPKILAGGSTSNGVFGAKVQWHQFPDLTTKLRPLRGDDSSEHELLRGAFPGLRYVFLTRRDKVRQAVSYYKAITTGIWWSIRADAEAAEPPPAVAPSPIVEPSFDFEQIDQWVRRFTDFESNWRLLFEEAGIKPFVVTYEDFVDEYESTVLAILDFLGIPASEGRMVAPPRLNKQADEASEQWVRRYRMLKRS